MRACRRSLSERKREEAERKRFRQMRLLFLLALCLFFAAAVAGERFVVEGAISPTKSRAFQTEKTEPGRERIFFSLFDALAAAAIGRSRFPTLTSSLSKIQKNTRRSLPLPAAPVPRLLRVRPPFLFLDSETKQRKHHRSDAGGDKNGPRRVGPGPESRS